MKEKDTFLILAYCPVRNRQGIDLNEMLNFRHFNSKLIQIGGKDDPEQKTIGIPVSPDVSGWRMRFVSRWARWQMFWKGCYNPHKITIAINIPALLSAIVLKLIFKSKLIFYSLEYHTLKPIDRLLLRRFCDAVIDVEETRRVLFLKQIGKALPSFILHNVPHYVDLGHLTPKLREWLIDNMQFRGDEFLVIYSGSYQKYCNLESIFEWAEDLSGHVRLIVLLTEIPESIKVERYKKTVFLPSKNHNELYNWLVDADLSLLPYESDEDNVRYCSPQKIFDALACGVPIMGSRRPLIELVTKKYHCGLTIDFTNENEFLKGVEWFAGQSRLTMRQNARAAHAEYNYGQYSSRLLSFINGLEGQARCETVK